jgi:SAM-dependent methyltransferase
VIFCSNFLEHLPHKPAVLQTLRECQRVLRAGGTLLILQPNVRYLAGRFWDYFDHHTPLTHLSLVEALRLTGFVPREVVPRFLPYTVKGTRLPRSTLLLKAYLRLRIAWPIFGRQMLIVAEAGRQAQ